MIQKVFHALSKKYYFIRMVFGLSSDFIFALIIWNYARENGGKWDWQTNLMLFAQIL